MKSSNEDYIKAIKKDEEHASDYYLKYLHTKSEQQKLLEKIILENKPESASVIADIACGAGSLTYHIHSLFSSAEYFLMDINSKGLELAVESTKNIKNKHVINASIFDLTAYKEKFDIVFCWQTLSFLDRPKEALDQLLQCCKKGGKLYLSSMFNNKQDVDVYSHVVDHTRDSAKEGIAVQYNTYSMYTIDKWLKGKVQSHKLHEFTPEIDFEYEGKGLGTFTVMTGEGKRLQISGGMLMNWGILEITK